MVSATRGIVCLQSRWPLRPGAGPAHSCAAATASSSSSGQRAAPATQHRGPLVAATHGAPARGISCQAAAGPGPSSEAAAAAASPGLAGSLAVTCESGARHLAAALAKDLRAGDIYLLFGAVGAGKSAFR
jgi:hypothetical protein